MIARPHNREGEMADDPSSSGDSDGGVLIPPCRSTPEEDEMRRRRRASVETVPSTVPSTPTAARWSFRDLFRRSPGGGPGASPRSPRGVLGGHHGGGFGGPRLAALPGLPDAGDPPDDEETEGTDEDGPPGQSELDTPCEPSRRRPRRGRGDGGYRRSTGHDVPLGGGGGNGRGERRRAPGIPSTICFDCRGGGGNEDDGEEGGESHEEDGGECRNAGGGGSVALSDVTPFTFGDEIAERTKREFLRRIRRTDFDANDMTESQYDELLSEIQEEQRLRFKRLRAQMDMCEFLSSSDQERTRPGAVTRSAGPETPSDPRTTRDCEPPSHWPRAGDEGDLGRGEEEDPEDAVPSPSRSMQVEVATRPVPPLERRPSARQPSQRKPTAGVQSSFTSVKTLKRENSSKDNKEDKEDNDRSHRDPDGADRAAGRPCSGSGPIDVVVAAPLAGPAPPSARSRFGVRRSYQMDDSDRRPGQTLGGADGSPTTSDSTSGDGISALIQTIRDENDRPGVERSKSYSELRAAMGVDRLAEEAARHDCDQPGGENDSGADENDGLRSPPPPTKTRADAGGDADRRPPFRRRASNASDHPHLGGLRASARSSMENSLSTGLTSAGAKTYDSATKLDTIIRLKLLVAHQQEEIDTLRAKMHNLEVLNRSLSDSDVCELRDSNNELRAENDGLLHELRLSQIRESDLHEALAENDELQSQLRKSRLRETDLRNELDRDVSLRLELDDVDDGRSHRSMGSNEAYILRRNAELQSENSELMQKVVELQVENEGLREENQRREEALSASHRSQQSSSRPDVPTKRMPMMNILRRRTSVSDPGTLARNPSRRRTSVSDPGSLAAGLSLLRRCAGGAAPELGAGSPSNINLRDPQNLNPSQGGRNLRGALPSPLDVSFGRDLDGSGRQLLDESGRSLPCIAVARTEGAPWCGTLERVPSGRVVEVSNRPVASGEWTESYVRLSSGRNASPTRVGRRATIDVACSQTSRKSSGIRTIATSFTSSFSSALSTNNSLNDELR